MPSKHRNEPAASLAERADDVSKEPGSPEVPRTFEEEESTTVPARRRSPKYLKVLVPGVRIAVKADDGE